MAPDDIDEPGESRPDNDEVLDVVADDEPQEDPEEAVAEPTVTQSSADLLAKMSGGDPEDGDFDMSPVFRRERPRILKGRPGRSPADHSSAIERSTSTEPADRAPAGRYRVRRVRRLIRHVEPWSVLKVCLVFYLCIWGLLVIATRMLWSAAEEAGTIGKVESFVEELFALESFAFDSAQIFRTFVLGGLVMVVGGIGITVVLVVLFNLISDLTGGIRFTMVEEETAVRQRRLRRGDVMVGTVESGSVPLSEAGSGE